MIHTLPLPAEPSLAQAAHRAWHIRHLYSEGAMDRNAALFSLSCLHQHSHPGIRSLCVRVAEAVERPRVGLVQPVVETFGRVP